MDTNIIAAFISGFFTILSTLLLIKYANKQNRIDESKKILPQKRYANLVTKSWLALKHFLLAWLEKKYARITLLIVMLVNLVVIIVALWPQSKLNTSEIALKMFDIHNKNLSRMNFVYLEASDPIMSQQDRYWLESLRFDEVAKPIKEQFLLCKENIYRFLKVAELGLGIQKEYFESSRSFVPLFMELELLENNFLVASRYQHLAEPINVLFTLVAEDINNPIKARYNQKSPIFISKFCHLLFLYVKLTNEEKRDYFSELAILRVTLTRIKDTSMRNALDNLKDGLISFSQNGIGKKEMGKVLATIISIINKYSIKGSDIADAGFPELVSITEKVNDLSSSPN